MRNQTSYAQQHQASKTRKSSKGPSTRPGSGKQREDRSDSTKLNGAIPFRERRFY
jgi:hypothetical protein